MLMDADVDNGCRLNKGLRLISVMAGRLYTLRVGCSWVYGDKRMNEHANKINKLKHVNQRPVTSQRIGKREREKASVEVLIPCPDI